MDANDFRRIALSFAGAEESAHMGTPDFRVGGHIFATLAAEAEGFGNLLLDPDEQQVLVDELPEAFLPVPGGWGRMGATHVRLAAVDEDVLTGALQTAWRLRLKKNERKRTTKGKMKSAPAAKPSAKRKAKPMRR